MNSLNTLILEGNLVSDPQFAYTPKGTPVCKFAVASNRYYKQDDTFQQEVSFFDVTAWSNEAERCQKELKKGSGIRITGRIKQDRWKDDSGKNKSKIYIVAEKIEYKKELK